MRLPLETSLAASSHHASNGDHLLTDHIWQKRILNISKSFDELA